MAAEGRAGPTISQDHPPTPTATTRYQYKTHKSETTGMTTTLCQRTVFEYKCGHKQASPDGITHSSDCAGVPTGEWFCGNTNSSGKIVVQKPSVCPHCFRCGFTGFTSVNGHQQDLGMEAHSAQGDKLEVDNQQPTTESAIEGDNASTFPGRYNYAGIPSNRNGDGSESSQYQPSILIPAASEYHSLPSHVGYRNLGRIDQTFHNFTPFGITPPTSVLHASGLSSSQLVYQHSYPQQVPIPRSFPLLPGNHKAGTTNYSRPFQVAPDQYGHVYHMPAPTNGEPSIVTSSSQQAGFPFQRTAPSRSGSLVESERPKITVKLPPQSTVSPQAWFGRRGQPLTGKMEEISFEMPKPIEPTSKELETFSEYLETSRVAIPHDVRQDKLKDYLKHHKLPTSLAHLYDSVVLPESEVLLKHDSPLDSALKYAGYQWPGTYSEKQNHTTSTFLHDDKVPLVPPNSPQADKIQRSFPPRTSSLPIRVNEMRASEDMFKPNNNTRQWSEQGESRIGAAFSHSEQEKKLSQAQEFQQSTDPPQVESIEQGQQQTVKEAELSRMENSRNQRTLAREKFAERLRNERNERHTNGFHNSAAIKNVNTSNSKVFRSWRKTSNEPSVSNAPATSTVHKIAVNHPSNDTTPTPHHNVPSDAHTTPSHEGNSSPIVVRMACAPEKSAEVAKVPLSPYTPDMAERFPPLNSEKTSVAEKVISTENISREVILSGDEEDGEDSHEEDGENKDVASETLKIDSEDEGWEMIPVEDEDI